MPPNTVLLSQVMQDLSREPGFTERLLAQLEGTSSPPGKRGPALLTPRLVDELRQRIFGKDWHGLDRFPGWTMREINPTVDLADHFIGKNKTLEGMTAVHPGAPAPQLSEAQARVFLDIGPYSLTREEVVSLDKPSTLPPFTTAGIVTTITPDLTRGDGPNQLAPEHAESQRLADVLNRLSANGMQGTRPFHVTLAGQELDTAQGLVDALASSGHQVVVTDSRYFANFGHLHYRGQDVMMPFWINTEIDVPHTGGLFHRPRPLLVPVSHAEYEWHIRGPRINADVSHYFGVDGKAEWRTMDTLDQRWVLKRDAHTYRGAEASEVTRLVSLVTVAYMHQHARRPQLPFGGYYTLGVCQDTVSAIERKLTGHTTLFPNTADTRLFDDPRDPEVNTLFRAIPKDREGARPEPARVFGSLPATAGQDNRFVPVTIPGLAEDLHASYTAWTDGTLREVSSRLLAMRTIAAITMLAAIFAFARVGLRRLKDH